MHKKKKKEEEEGVSRGGKKGLERRYKDSICKKEGQASCTKK